MSLADRYLVYTAAVDDEEAPSLLLLAVTCLLMAVKLEQSVSPSFTRMINLIAELHEVTIEK